MNRFVSEIKDYLYQSLVIAELEARKLRHDPTEVLTRAIQPALWLVVFGEVFAQLHEIPTGDLSYLAFMAPGVLAQSVLFVSIFYGISIIFERDAGLVQKFLTSPTPRSAIVTGKALSAGIRGLTQALIVYVLAVLLGVHMVTDPFSVVMVVIIVVLCAAIFSTLSLMIACVVKTRDRFMGIGQMISMPLFLASNAIYPISMMPEWLRVVALWNPLTYAVDALRGLMISGASYDYSLGFDVGVLAVFTLVLIWAGGRLYPRVAR